MGHRPPLSSGSISLRIYPHGALPVEAAVDEMRAQAAAAVGAGFDGVMTSEHHGGFAGYLPNPLQAAGWLLEVMPHGWAAPCPMLLPLRPTALVIEEVAWLTVRYPDRVGVGVAAGSLVDDFAIMGLTKDDLTARFATALAQLSDALGGRHPGPLAGDPAVARCAAHPVPTVSAAMSVAAVRRAAALGTGIIFDSLSAPGRLRTLADAYGEAGGDRARILVRRVWVGAPPTETMARQVDVYRGYAASGAQSHWGTDEVVAGPDARSVAEELVDVMVRCGADAVNVRLHAPGITPGQVREQIAALADVLSLVRARMGSGTGTRPGTGPGGEEG
ncbi:MAG: LLM class flavin-dependent oxidoreductase [Acidimicrobiales bacterium]